MRLPIILSGTVIHGNHIGTGLGMPTANINPTEKIEGIDKGVYYSKVEVDGTCYKAITNVGTKPTIKGDNEVNVESFLYDFAGDLYEKDIKVTLCCFRRPEMKFSSLEELSFQVKKDIEAGRDYVN